MDIYRAPHNQFCLNENVVQKELLRWLWQTRKYVWEGSEQASRTKLQGPELHTCLNDERWHKHFLTPVNGDNIEQRAAGQLQCKPLTTLEKIALERYAQWFLTSKDVTRRATNYYCWQFVQFVPGEMCVSLHCTILHNNMKY